MKKISEKRLKALLRPMFCSTIMFGYATEKQVEECLTRMSKKPLKKEKE